MRVLLVEDDNLLASGLSKRLSRKGFPTECASTARAAQQKMFDHTPDIVILDIGLPDLDGFSLLVWLRNHFNKTPALILTARDSLSDKVNGLDSGADDYMVKPFDTDELCARLRVLGRRFILEHQNEIISGAIKLDVERQLIFYNDNVVETSHREFLLMKFLMQNQGTVQSRKSLEAHLYQWNDEVCSNAIDVHVHNLRKKLGPKSINTIRGVGYVVNKQ